MSTPWGKRTHTHTHTRSQVTTNGTQLTDGPLTLFCRAASCRVLFLMSKSGYQPPKLKDKSKWWIQTCNTLWFEASIRVKDHFFVYIWIFWKKRHPAFLLPAGPPCFITLWKPCWWGTQRRDPARPRCSRSVLFTSALSCCSLAADVYFYLNL